MSGKDETRIDVDFKPKVHEADLKKDDPIRVYNSITGFWKSIT